jgi:zeaxanthin epoxidase
LVRRYIKFDTFHPAVSKGLPVTRVISRITLQEILADAVDKLTPADKKGSIIRNSANVVSFQETQDPATGASGGGGLYKGGLTGGVAREARKGWVVRAQLHSEL